jgi:hypothetical protein
LPGQAHLIFETGPAGCIITNLFSNLCCIKALYKLPEKLDALALTKAFYN